MNALGVNRTISMLRVSWVAAIALGFSAPVTGSAEDPSALAVEQWAASHPAGHRYDVIEARSQTGLYVGVGVGVSLALDEDVLPSDATSAETVPRVGGGPSVRLGALVGRVGLGFRTDVTYVHLSGAGRDTTDARLILWGVDAELDVPLGRTAPISVRLTPSVGIAGLFANTALTARDVSDDTTARFVPRTGLRLGVERSPWRADLGVTLVYPVSTAGQLALPALLPMLDLSVSFVLRRSEVRP